MGYIRKWEAPDDKTVILTTYEPFYGFIQALNFWVLPYDIGYNASQSQPAYPIGTGPYQTQDYRPGVRIELVQNERMVAGTIADRNNYC